MTATHEEQFIDREISHTNIAPGIHKLKNAEVFAVDSSSSDHIYTAVIANGHGTCSCPARIPNCRHVRQVLAARAGF